MLIARLPQYIFFKKHGKKCPHEWHGRQRKKLSLLEPHTSLTNLKSIDQKERRGSIIFFVVVIIIIDVYMEVDD